jgi:hypothetical protein
MTVNECRAKNPLAKENLTVGMVAAYEAGQNEVLDKFNEFLENNYQRYLIDSRDAPLIDPDDISELIKSIQGDE